MIEDLKKITSCLDKYRSGIDRASPTAKKDILSDLIQSEFSEILVILNIIKEKFDQLRKYDLGSGEELSQSGFALVFKYPREIKVLIKSCYEWIYHIKNLIESNEKIKQSISKKIFSQIKSICEFRGELIAHKSGLKIYSMGAIRHNAKDYRAEIMMTPFNVSEEICLEVDRVYDKAAEKCADLDKNQKNFHERCGLLHKHLDELPTDLKKQALAIIRKYGAISLNTNQLTEFVRIMAEEIIPKISRGSPIGETSSKN